jgi:hypothetical protein
MKFDPNQSIEEILKAFVEETHQRAEEDRALFEYVRDYISLPYTVPKLKAIDEVWYYLRWSITSCAPIDRSCFDKEIANESQIDSLLDLGNIDNTDRL